MATSIISCPHCGEDIELKSSFNSDEINKLMTDLGWDRVWHMLPTQKKGEHRFHKEGSEILEDEAKAILLLPVI